MRWVLGFLVVTALGLAGALVWFLTAQPRQSVSAAAAREPESTPGGSPADPDGASASNEPVPAVRFDDEALLRLEAELARAPATGGRTDGQRLAEAWEWVRANRSPDRSYNQLEARMLALIEGTFDGQERSILWAMNTSMLEVEMVRALDANADGQVTDAEVEAFAAENINLLSALDHPYIRLKLDADRDGELSPDEVSVLHDLASMHGAFASVLKRAQVEAWDTDLDGALTDTEIEAGKETTLASLQYFEDGHIEVAGDPSQIDPAEQEAVKQSLAEHFGPTVLETMEAQKEIKAAQALAQGLLDAMRVENLDQNLMGEHAMQELPRAPQQMDFDVNGDGQIDGVEGEAFAAAAQEYQNQVATWTAKQTAMALRMEFEHATRQHDLNNDGRLSDREWDTRMEDLLAARERRLFLRSYDLDGNGRVDSTELTRFLDWHKAGSIRADANFDGVVNALDLQAMIKNYTKQ